MGFGFLQGIGAASGCEDMVTALAQYVGHELHDDWVIIDNQDSFLIGVFLG